MTAAERAKFSRQVQTLACADHDRLVDSEGQRDIRRWINPQRVEIGAEPFVDPLYPPELEFFRRAFALGMARADR